MAQVHPYYHSPQKRLFDFVLALIVVISLAPLLVILSGFILVLAGWPVVFKQRRIGYRKQIFWMYKFRTMYVGAEKDQKKYRHLNEAPEPMFKLTKDPRFVGIGSFLSRTGLDELPQLFNILKGEMSFVGPRPLPLKEAERLDRSWDFRYKARPGIFSEWSLSLARFKSSMSWKTLEKKTLEKGNPIIDIQYIVKTLVAHISTLL